MTAVGSVEVVGDTVRLHLQRGFAPDETVTVSYFPGNTPIQDLAGNDADLLSDQALVNRTDVGTLGPEPGFQLDAWQRDVMQALQAAVQTNVVQQDAFQVGMLWIGEVLKSTPYPGGSTFGAKLSTTVVGSSTLGAQPNRKARPE